MRRFKKVLQRVRSKGSPPPPPPPPAAQAAISEQRDPPPSQTPAPGPAPGPAAAAATATAATAAPTSQATGSMLNIALQNQTTSQTVYAYVTGRALDRGNAWFLLSADGHTPYYPSSPSSVGSPMAQNCAIPLGRPGNTVTVTIPHIAGGRIWFSIDAPLTFLLNPGPALVEPSVTNASDPNIHTNWGFAEFTFNADQLYANISYVDFVGPPIALTLTSATLPPQHVAGMPSDGLDQVCAGLRAQHARDNQGWDQLIVTTAAQGAGQQQQRNLRALSPNQAMVTNPALFATYYDDYVARAWRKFAAQPMSVDTQAAFGTVSAQVDHGSGTLNFRVADGAATGNAGGSATTPLSFTKPSTRDIFSCSTGPFATGSNPAVNAIIPRLAAAFNRSTLLETDVFPAPQALYYKDATTNHYSRIVHAVNLDGKGYAFPYDDVQPSGGADQSGEVHAGDPILFTVTVGGGNAAGAAGTLPRREL
ncbi:carbohydrate binding family 6 [Cladophialophora carrionii]|uniref:Carbohydrate binding family 6 n=1 Tax=Cladophialophora carrionii TaxID=86049 RepID=A0A1C1CNN6_9EURO|nr:carbohydrate binding family 6 [Cladophialophora carrionii]